MPDLKKDFSFIIECAHVHLVLVISHKLHSGAVWKRVDHLVPLELLAWILTLIDDHEAVRALVAVWTSGVLPLVHVHSL